jgi:hypothetical protein
MIVMKPKRNTVYQALFVAGALAVPVLLYAMGFPTLGGVLLLSKALVCAGLAVDALFGGVRAMQSYRLINHDVTFALLLTVTGLLTIGAGLFLTRWFAGYLLSKR